MQRRQRTGDWESVPPESASQAVNIEVAYTLDLLSNISGGIDRGARGLGNLDIQLTAELEPLLDWPGARVFLYGLGNSGASISRAVGDIQGVSNIEAPHTFKLFEAWLEQDFAAGRASVLAGLFDLNSEFDVIGAATLFLQSSHGIGAEFGGAGRNGPSIFPSSSVSTRLALHVTESAYARLLVADGVPGDPEDPYGTQVVLDEEDGLLLAAEIGVYNLPSLDRAPARSGKQAPPPSERRYGLFGKYAIGVWNYTGKFDDFSLAGAAGEPRQRRSDPGIYALAEQRVYFEAQDPVQGLSLFTRVGVADESVNAIDAYVGAGCVYRGLLPERDRDRFGLAIAAAHFGDDYQRTQSAGERDDWEIAFELSYEARLSPWISIQPTLQHVLNPGGDATLDDATVVGVRFFARL